MDKNKILKKCPRCKIYTEKNEGCNHMTCPHCQYQWCWLCEGRYTYGHYNQGRCNGLQFVIANNIKEARRRAPRILQNRGHNRRRTNRRDNYIIKMSCLFLYICVFVILLAFTSEQPLLQIIIVIGIGLRTALIIFTRYRYRHLL